MKRRGPWPPRKQVRGWSRWLGFAGAAAPAAALALMFAFAPGTTAAQSSDSAGVQAKAQSAPAVSAMTDSIANFTGTWMLDKKNSDDPAKLWSGGGGGGGGGHHGWGRGHGGYGGHGGEGHGSHSGGGPPRDAESGEQRPRTGPQPEKLVLDQHDAALDWYDGTQLARTFSWAATPSTGQVVHATWKARNLTGEAQGPRGSVSYTFSLDQDGKALTTLMRMNGRDGNAVELRSRYTKYEGE